MPDDEVSAAFATVKQFTIRRLPVVDSNGRLQGVISMNDIVLAADQKQGPATEDIVATLAAICAHRSVKAAAA
jgi:CBS domain-containing protein